MKLLLEPKLSPSDKCPYLPERDAIQEYFFALDINQEEIDILINSGWRKFGAYIFRPNCSSCNKCTPLRVPVKDFLPNKKQRKLLRKSEKIRIEIETLSYKTEYFKIFCDHSVSRFNLSIEEVGSEENFKETFFIKASPSLTFNYYLENKLIAWGIIDKGLSTLNSVYFAFDPSYSNLELGKLSILKEIEYAKESKISYYHLGYYVDGNKSMAYKASYYPHEQMSWSSGSWNIKVK